MTHDPLCDPRSRDYWGDYIPCQCDLIARVRADQRENDAYELDEAKIRKDERAKTLDAAYNAVAAVPSQSESWSVSWVWKHDALAAIDALREGTK